MGIEYKIAIPKAAVDTVDGILRSAKWFTQTIQTDQQLVYEYRMPNNFGRIPNGHAYIESDGIYFCDFGGSRDTMADVVQQIADRIGTPDVAELE